MNAHRLFAVLLLALVLPFGMRIVQADTIPTPGRVDPRVRVVVYNPDDVVELHGYVGYQIHIQWARGEEFVNLGSGDNAAIDVGAEGDNFFIKPRQEHARTNLTVLTNRRVYQFEYTVSKPPPAAQAKRRMVYSIRFIYPQDEARQAQAELERQRVDQRLRVAGKSGVLLKESRNTDYWFCGSETLKPMSAYDDGVQTRLRFQARSEFPAIFVKNDDGSESLLNFNIENDEVVIHRVARRFVLRRGQLVGCVVNRSFAGGGARMQSNTAVPDVDRVTKGAQP